MGLSELNLGGRIPNEPHENIRISYSSLLSLRDTEGRYALLLNRGRFFRGADIVYTPIGGGVELTNAGRNRLQGIMQLDHPVPLEQGNDARFLMDDDTTLEARVLGWFAKTKRRETNPKRETQEELVDELGLLDEREIAKISISKKRRIATPYRDTTSRRGWNGGTTLMAAEIHDARITDLTVDTKLHDATHIQNKEKLKEILEEYRSKPGVNPVILEEVAELIANEQLPPLIYWATKEEIEKLQTQSGFRIGRICQTLLE